MVSVISCPFHLISLELNFNDFSHIHKVKGTQKAGSPQDGLQEKNVENKSCLEFNFKKLLFSTLFSRS